MVSSLKSSLKRKFTVASMMFSCPRVWRKEIVGLTVFSLRDCMDFKKKNNNKRMAEICLLVGTFNRPQLSPCARGIQLSSGCCCSQVQFLPLDASRHLEESARTLESVTSADSQPISQSVWSAGRQSMRQASMQAETPT